MLAIIITLSSSDFSSGIDLKSDDYLGVGLEDGLLKVVWNLGWFTRTELTVPDRNLTDGAWHSLSVKRVRQQMEELLDELSYVSQVHGTYHELNTENKVKWYSSNVGYTFFDPIKTKVIIGSAESGVLVEDLTRGHFR